MTIAPELTDGVVVLNLLQPDDAVVQWEGEDEEQARRFGWYPKRSTLDQVKAAIEEWQRQWETEGDIRTFAVRDAADGTLFGGCQIRRKTPQLAHMSYWIFPPHRGRGFATRALRLGAAFAFENLGVSCVELEVEPDNDASRGVARGAGFLEQGTVRHNDEGREFEMVHYYLER
jgi:RimJ/RimL family protein N-acetyltransferase